MPPILILIDSDLNYIRIFGILVQYLEYEGIFKSFRRTSEALSFISSNFSQLKVPLYIFIDPLQGKTACIECVEFLEQNFKGAPNLKVFVQTHMSDLGKVYLNYPVVQQVLEKPINTEVLKNILCEQFLDLSFKY